MTGGGDRPLLAMDTATSRAAVAVGTADGRALATRAWETGHRPGSLLLDAVDDVLREAGTTLRDLGAIAVGIGPGSFTGLRVALATAKTLAYALDVPLVGVSTPVALAAAAARHELRHADRRGDGDGDGFAVALPAGATDRYLVRVRHAGDGTLSPHGPAQLVPGAVPLVAEAATALLVAVDIDGPGVPEDARARGRSALDRLADEVLALGARELAAGRIADVAGLVPAYVTLPRGVTRAAEEMSWSPDLR